MDKEDPPLTSIPPVFVCGEAQTMEQSMLLLLLFFFFLGGLL